MVFHCEYRWTDWMHGLFFFFSLFRLTLLKARFLIRAAMAFYFLPIVDSLLVDILLGILGNFRGFAKILHQCGFSGSVSSKSMLLLRAYVCHIFIAKQSQSKVIRSMVSMVIRISLSYAS